MAKKKTVARLSEIPLGGLFVHVAPYIKVSKTMGLPVIATGRDDAVTKRKFKANQEVELPKALKITGKQGSMVNVQW